jgi:hypothetical protein
MSKAIVLAFALALPGSPAAAQQMLDLNCMDALVAAEKSSLAGVFSFIPQKDTTAAFSDLIVRDKKALKKYIAKVEKDLKVASGITLWDHEVVLNALSLFGSPLAATFEAPPKKITDKLTELSVAPTLSLEQVTARRKAS